MNAHKNLRKILPSKFLGTRFVVLHSYGRLIRFFGMVLFVWTQKLLIVKVTGAAVYYAVVLTLSPFRRLRFGIRLIMLLLMNPVILLRRIIAIAPGYRRIRL